MYFINHRELFGFRQTLLPAHGNNEQAMLRRHQAALAYSANTDLRSFAKADKTNCNGPNQLCRCRR
jgi:hypothetical protein